MTHRPDWHDYEVEPDRIVRRGVSADQMISNAAVIAVAFAATLGAICVALLIWGW